MAARRPAENAELVLHANHVHVRDVQKIRRAQVGRQVLFRNLEAHLRRIIVTLREIIDRHDEALHRWKLRRHGAAQVRRERGDAAFPRQVIAEKRDLADGRGGLHKSVGVCAGKPACAGNPHGAPRRSLHQEPFPTFAADGRTGMVACSTFGCGLVFISPVFRSLMTERQVLFDSINVRGSNEGRLSQRPAAFGIFALQQVASTGAPEKHFAGAGDFETFGHCFSGFSTFGASHTVLSLGVFEYSHVQVGLISFICAGCWTAVSAGSPPPGANLTSSQGAILSLTHWRVCWKPSFVAS